MAMYQALVWEEALETPLLHLESPAQVTCSATKLKARECTPWVQELLGRAKQLRLQLNLSSCGKQWKRDSYFLP